MSRPQSLGLGPGMVKLHRDAAMGPQFQVPFFILSSEKLLLFLWYLLLVCGWLSHGLWYKGTKEHAL